MKAIDFLEFQCALSIKRESSLFSNIVYGLFPIEEGGENLTEQHKTQRSRTSIHWTVCSSRTCLRRKAKDWIERWVKKFRRSVRALFRERQSSWSESSCFARSDLSKIRVLNLGLRTNASATPKARITEKNKLLRNWCIVIVSFIRSLWRQQYYYHD